MMTQQTRFFMLKKEDVNQIFKMFGKISNITLYENGLYALVTYEKIIEAFWA
jgi:hypothetical protein